MKISENLRDVDERITILRYEIIRTEYKINDTAVELANELERIRYEVYEYLNELRIFMSEEWNSLRTEIDFRFSEFDNIWDVMAVHKKTAQNN